MIIFQYNPEMRIMTPQTTRIHVMANITAIITYHPTNNKIHLDRIEVKWSKTKEIPITPKDIAVFSSMGECMEGIATITLQHFPLKTLNFSCNIHQTIYTSTYHILTHTYNSTLSPPVTCSMKPHDNRTNLFLPADMPPMYINPYNSIPHNQKIVEEQLQQYHVTPQIDTFFHNTYIEHYIQHPKAKHTTKIHIETKYYTQKMIITIPTSTHEHNIYQTPNMVPNVYRKNILQILQKAIDYLLNEQESKFMSQHTCIKDARTLIHYQQHIDEIITCMQKQRALYQQYYRPPR